MPEGTDLTVATVHSVHLNPARPTGEICSSSTDVSLLRGQAWFIYPPRISTRSLVPSCSIASRDSIEIVRGDFWSSWLRVPFPTVF